MLSPDDVFFIPILFFSIYREMSWRSLKHPLLRDKLRYHFRCLKCFLFLCILLFSRVFSTLSRLWFLPLQFFLNGRLHERLLEFQFVLTDLFLGKKVPLTNKSGSVVDWLQFPFGQSEKGRESLYNKMNLRTVPCPLRGYLEMTVL